MCFGRPVTSAAIPAAAISRFNVAIASAMNPSRSGAPLVELARDPLVELGLEEPEREVLELPLELPDAEPVGERRVDVERFPRDRPAEIVGRLAEKAQRLGTAREADQHDADVLHHRQQHLAEDLRLGVLRLLVADGEPARDHPQPIEPRDAADERGDGRVETLGEPIGRRRQVLRHREEQPGGAGRSVGPELREVGGEPVRVLERRLAGAEQLALVERRGELERALDEPPFGRLETRERGLDCGRRRQRCVGGALGDGDHGEAPCGRPRMLPDGPHRVRHNRRVTLFRSLAPQAHPAPDPHRRCAVAPRHRRTAVPRRDDRRRARPAARARAALPPREGDARGRRPRAHRRDPTRHRGAGGAAGAQPRARSLRRLGRRRRLPRRVPRAPAGARRGRRHARMGRRAVGRGVAGRPGPPVVGRRDARHDRARRGRRAGLQRRDPRVRAQDRHAERRGGRLPDAARGHGRRGLDAHARVGLRAVRRHGGPGAGDAPRSVRGRAPGGVLRGRERGVLHRSARAAQGIPRALRPARVSSTARIRPRGCRRPSRAAESPARSRSGPRASASARGRCRAVPPLRRAGRWSSSARRCRA